MDKGGLGRKWQNLTRWSSYCYRASQIYAMVRPGVRLGVNPDAVQRGQRSHQHRSASAPLGLSTAALAMPLATGRRGQKKGGRLSAPALI